MLKLLSALAPAKINLFLRITGRRPDGYHELDSIFAPVALCDRIALAMRPGPTTAIVLRCAAAGLGPEDQNLAVRAARAFMAEFALTAELRIDLHKAIPAGAGLGGGSSDAGTVLRMLAQLCSLDEPRRMAAIAVKLGADVPFFLDPKPARVRGIGELIEPLDHFPQLPLVIAVPPVTVSTAEVFKRLPRDAWSGAASPDTIAAICAGRIQRDRLVNDLAGVATAQWPAIAELRAALDQLGAIGSAMSGSGGAVFGVFPSTAAAQDAAAELRRLKPSAQIFAVTTIGAS